MFRLRGRRVHIVVLVVAVTVIALLVGLAGHQGRAVTPGGAATAQAAGTNSLEGVWYVMAEGAPFQPHLFTFHSDGTMLTHNPETADPSGSDSAGMGPWKRLSGNEYKGRFVQINAYWFDYTGNPALQRKYKDDLVVDFSVKVTGDTFVGPASVNYYNGSRVRIGGPWPATLHGQRITFGSPWAWNTPTGPYAP